MCAQKAYLLGYKRALAQARRELDAVIRDLNRSWEEEVAELKNAVDEVERDRETAEAVARAEREPEVRLH